MERVEVWSMVMFADSVFVSGRQLIRVGLPISRIADRTVERAVERLRL